MKKFKTMAVLGLVNGLDLDPDQNKIASELVSHVLGVDVTDEDVAVKAARVIKDYIVGQQPEWEVFDIRVDDCKGDVDKLRKFIKESYSEEVFLDEEPVIRYDHGVKQELNRLGVEY